MISFHNEQIFISYSRRDDAMMQHVVKYLREEGLYIWLDNENLVPGTPVWEVELEKAIKRSDAVVVLLSPDSKSSEWVTRELVIAQRHKKRIFPILIRGDEDSSLHFRLSTHQYIDFRNREAKGLRELYTAIADHFIFQHNAKSVGRSNQPRSTHITRKNASAKSKERLHDQVSTSKAQINFVMIIVAFVISGLSTFVLMDPAEIAAAAVLPIVYSISFFLYQYFDPSRFHKYQFFFTIIGLAVGGILAFQTYYENSFFDWGGDGGPPTIMGLYIAFGIIGSALLIYIKDKEGK